MKHRINFLHHSIFWVLYSISLSLSDWSHGVSYFKVLSFALLSRQNECNMGYWNKYI